MVYLILRVIIQRSGQSYSESDCPINWTDIFKLDNLIGLAPFYNRIIVVGLPNTVKQLVINALR